MEFHINNYSRFADLPLQLFEKLEYSIYILDCNWNYLYVNPFAYKNLNVTENLIGKNMWKAFPVLAVDPDYRRMRKDIEKKKVTNLITVSPVTSKRLSIVGSALEDCYFFSTSILLNKVDLITDLRKSLDKT